MATKRMITTTATSCAGTAKKAKTVLDPVAAAVLDLVGALGEAADLAPSVREVLVGVIPHSLAVPKDVRHKYQEEAVAMISDALSKMDSGFEGAVKLAQDLKLDSSKQVESQGGVLEKTQSELSAKKETKEAHKAQLADVARAFQKTKAALQEVLALQETGLGELGAAEQTKAKVEALQTEIETVHEGGVKACAQFLNRLAQHVPIDETMKTAIPPALAKDVASRGGFDAMVVQQVSVAVEKRLVELNEKIATAEPVKAALLKDVASAQTAHAAAKEKQMDAAGAFRKVDKEATVCTETLKAGQKELANFRKQQKKALDGLFDAEYSRDNFKTGPLEVFAFLRERETPPPAPEVTAAADEAMEGVAPEQAPTIAAEETPIAVAAC